MFQIKEYGTDLNNNFFIVAKIKTDNDALLLQSIFRDALLGNKGVISFYGLNENFEEVLAFKYPKNRLFRLGHIGQGENTKYEFHVFPPSPRQKPRGTRGK